MLVVPVGPWLADGIGWLSWHTAAQPFGSVQIVFAGQDRFGLFRLGAPSRIRTCVTAAKCAGAAPLVYGAWLS